MSKLLRGLALSGVALALLLVEGRAQAGGGFELISPAEARQEARALAEAPEQIVPRVALPPRADAPAIRVVSPSINGSGVVAPVRIELAFKPAPGARSLAPAGPDMPREPRDAAAGPGPAGAVTTAPVHVSPRP